MRKTTKKEQWERLLVPFVIFLVFLLLELQFGARDWTFYAKNPMVIGFAIFIALWIRLIANPYIDIKELFMKALAPNATDGDKWLAGLVYMGSCILIGLIVLAFSFR